MSTCTVLRWLPCEVLWKLVLKVHTETCLANWILVQVEVRSVVTPCSEATSYNPVKTWIWIFTAVKTSKLALILIPVGRIWTHTWNLIPICKVSRMEGLYFTYNFNEYSARYETSSKPMVFVHPLFKSQYRWCTVAIFSFYHFHETLFTLLAIGSSVSWSI
jgi:hypothetical protein